MNRSYCKLVLNFIDLLTVSPRLQKSLVKYVVVRKTDHVY